MSKVNRNYRQILSQMRKLLSQRSASTYIVSSGRDWHFKCSSILMFTTMFVIISACVCQSIRSSARRSSAGIQDAHVILSAKWTLNDRLISVLYHSYTHTHTHTHTRARARQRERKRERESSKIDDKYFNEKSIIKMENLKICKK